MEDVTKYILALLETMELELNLFRLKIGRLTGGIVLFLVGSLLLLAGILVMAWALFHFAVLLIGEVGAGFITGCLILLCGGVFLWIARKNLK